MNPPCASILRGVTIPPYGGDTFWTNLAAAYAGLSEPMRAFVDGLRAISAAAYLGLSEPMRAFVDRLRGIHAFEPRGDDKAGSEYNERVKRLTEKNWKVGILW